MLAAIKGYKTGPVPKAPADNAKVTASILLKLE